MTTGDAIKIKVPNGGNEEFYFLENRQNISIYDNATQNPIDKGLFIHHLRGHYSNEEDLRMIPSFGNWNWITDGTTTVSGNTVSIMKKSTPDQAGLSYNEPLPGVSSDEWMHAYKDESGTLFTGGIFRGNNVTTSFNYTNRPLFASNTNPSPTNWLGSGNDIAVKILNEYNGKVKIDVLINYDPYSISENTTWDGQIFLDNSMTVQSGAKLTIKPNTIVYVEDSKAINVYGELDANGVEFLPMNSTWNGITFHNGSDGEIANSTITGVHSYGGAAIKVYTDNHIEIHGNTITDITGAASGILFSSASDGYAYENHIENTSSYGIYAYNSSVRAFNNFIKGHSSAGVYSTGSSNVLFSAVTSPYYEGENTIVGGKYGLQIGSSSTLHAGNSSTFASQNRIANQSGSGWAHIYSTSYYTNYAQYNYFKPYNGGGGSAPTVSGWGPVTTTPYLTTDPDPSVGFKRLVNQDEPIVFSSLDEEKLFEALELKLQSDFEEAANLFEELVKQSISTHIVEQSLHELAWINIGVKDFDLLNRFYNLEQDLIGTQFEFDYQLEKARVHYANKELGLALDLIESVMEFVDEIDPQKLKNASILAAHIASDLGDSELAISFMNQAVSHKTKSLDEFMLLELQNYIETKEGSPRHTEPEFNEFDTPTTVSLDNYLNPFNPTTNIRFNIPTDGHVELVVFDVLGRKVAELVNEFRNQGTHTISFDASSFSSGIYLYQLRVNGEITTKQMTLIK